MFFSDLHFKSHTVILDSSISSLVLPVLLHEFWASAKWYTCNWAFSNKSLNDVDFFQYVQYYKLISSSLWFLIHFLFSSFFTVTIQYITHIAYTICVSQLLILSLRLLVVKQGSEKLHVDFWLHGETVPLTHVLFKGQFCMYLRLLMNCTFYPH